tara:strand:+ start:5421 stop:6440 length:1020 start_codon:yes stop_codon:yes gene_type:complete
MSNKDLIIINNEKISQIKNNYHCENIDLKTIPENLGKNFNVTLIARNSKIERSRHLNLEKIELSSNIFGFLFNILKTFKKKEATYLIISITPYTFLSYILLFIFRKKIFVYLRSDGYEEYKAILGFLGPLIYYVMFNVVTFKTNIIKCQERLFTKRKSHTIFPSELNSFWLENFKKPKLDKPRLLYVGRIKVEKGIFSLLNIFDQINDDVELSIVGRDEEKKINNKRINYIGHGYNASELINIYDNHNISVLPSFTEAHPKVVDESLARFRPVIVFDDIKHIVQNKKGIFVSKRNANSLLETIDFIMKNYSNIQGEMNMNKLPTKQNFIDQFSDILNSN